MLMVVAIVLFVFWLLGLFVFKITKGFIHLVLLIAIVAIVLHFVRGG
jgi:Family of unknown function (DUF5670)